MSDQAAAPQGMALFLAVLLIVQSVSPGFDRYFKNDSRLMKFIGVLLFFNKSFMTAFITTFLNRTWFPTPEYVANNPDGAADVLCHEGVHAYDEHTMPLQIKLGSYRGSLLYHFLYLFPASLGAMVFGTGLLFTIFGIFVHAFLPMAWLMLVGVLVAAIPVAPFRMQIEMRGYGMSLLVCYLRGMRKDTDWYRDTMASYTAQFTGPNYYFMWPFKSSVQKRLELIWADIESGRIYEGDRQVMFRKVRDLYQPPAAAPTT